MNKSRIFGDYSSANSIWLGNFGTVVGILISLGVFLAIWLPEFSLWYVKPNNTISNLTPDARNTPAEAILEELGKMDLGLSLGLMEPFEIIQKADELSRGILTFPGFNGEKISPVFDKNDLEHGTSRWQLIFASLASVDILLEAHILTKNEKYFALAKENIEAFSRFEASALLDKGFLWNDHAIGARIPVLIKFWNLCRTSFKCSHDTERLVLTLVARSGLLLAKPEHYSWRTGHGIVQDLALLQISAAFPYLSESSYFRNIAVERFSSHMSYYVNREGVTLLHSAGYHSSGIYFLGAALRLFTLNKLSIPAEWWSRYEKAKSYYAILRRPDGTLPMFGDTGNAADLLGPPQTYRTEDLKAAPLVRTGIWYRDYGLRTFPEAGHAIWWRSNLGTKPEFETQTVLTWSYYPSLGHKLADELSVLIWGGGRNWLTNVGYWPYGHPQRPSAESWGGSNAPHLTGEAASSDRTSSLTAIGSDADSVIIQMQRNGPDGYSVDRTVMHFCESLWLVMDQHQDRVDRSTATFWTMYPDLALEPRIIEGSFIAFERSESAGYTMASSYQTSQGGVITTLFGSSEPFAGWVVMGQTPVRASSVAIWNRSKNGWQLSAFSLEHPSSRGRDADFSAKVSEWGSSNHWTATVSETANCPEMTVKRYPEYIILKKHTKPDTHMRIELTSPPDVRSSVTGVLDALHTSALQSKRRQSLFPYRLKVTYLLLGVLLVQEVGFHVLRKSKHSTNILSLTRALAMSAWLGVGFWLANIYLVAT